MARWRIEPAERPLRGAVFVPGDKSIAHRAWMLAPLASGVSRIRGVPTGDDVRRSREAMLQLGAVAHETEPGAWTIEGRGLRGLRAPTRGIDCGSSGTTLRLLAGLLSWQHFDSRLDAGAQLARRPMARITRPLRNRGARIDGVFDAAQNDEHAPLDIHGIPEGVRLNPADVTLEIASAQLKGALLLSGLAALGPTLVSEPVVTRDHTERMFDVMGAPLRTAGTAVALDPTDWDGKLRPLDFTVPGDLSSATFLLVAAHIVRGSRIVVKGVGTNRTRSGALDVLREMGGGASIEDKGESGGEPVGDLHIGANGIVELRRAARVAGELSVRAIDEVPALVAAAVYAPGASEFRDVRELRVKESDRIAALAAMLSAFGVQHEVHDDGLTVDGGRGAAGGHAVAANRVIDPHGDHRIAMAAAIVALGARGPTVIGGVECVDKSFPGFEDALRRLGATIVREEDN